MSNLRYGTAPSPGFTFVEVDLNGASANASDKRLVRCKAAGRSRHRRKHKAQNYIDPTEPDAKAVLQTSKSEIARPCGVLRTSLDLSYGTRRLSPNRISD